MNNAPVMFISHGAPTFALSPGEAGRLLRRVGKQFSQVKGIAILSPHWMSRHQEISASDKPTTIHDFGGFPDDLYTIGYPAPGNPALAVAVQNMLAEHAEVVTLNHERGRDHGVWVPMLHLLPEANIPIVQLSLKYPSSRRDIVNLGRSLQPLRAQGIAIIGSGGVTHNLADIGAVNQAARPYAVSFQNNVREYLLKKEYDQLIDNAEAIEGFYHSHPSDEHYLPLLFAIGALTANDQLQVLKGGIVHRSLSMESYFWH